MPSETSQVFKLRVPRAMFIVLGSILVVAMLIGTVGIYQTFIYNERFLKYEALRVEHLARQVTTRRLQNQVSNFKLRLDQLTELDRKLRLVAGIELQSDKPIYGMGGVVLNRKIGSKLPKGKTIEKTSMVSILEQDLTSLSAYSNEREVSLQSLKSFLMEKKDVISHTPYRWPVRGFISSSFGIRLDPFTGTRRYHEGVDIVTSKGTPVLAPAHGIVRQSRLVPGFGNMVVIDHGYGFTTRYGHNEKLLVRKGQRIKRGHPIATVGSTGRSTGPHLHYEIRLDNVPIDPLKIIVTLP